MKFGFFRKLITETIRSYLLLDRELIIALWEATASALRRRRLRKSCLSEIQCFESRVVLSADSLSDAFSDSVVSDDNATIFRATEGGNSERGFKPTEADEWLSAVDANMASWDGNTAVPIGERIVSAAGMLAATDSDVSAIGRELTLSLPDTRIGVHYETVTIGSDGSVYGAPLRDPNQSLTDSVNLHSSDRNSHSGESLLAHGEDNLEHHEQAGDKHVLAEMDTRAKDFSIPRPQVVSGSLKNDAAGAIAESLNAYLTNAFPDAVVTRSGNVVGSQSRQFGGLTASAFGYEESAGSRAAFAAIEGVPSLSLMDENRRANSSFPRIVNAGLNVLSEKTSQLWPLLSDEAEKSRLFLVSSDRVDFNVAPATSMISSASQVSSFSGMVREERTGINGASNTTLTSARRQEFDQDAGSQAGSSASARYERIFRLLHRYWKALKARYSGARMRASVEPADEVITPEMQMQSELSAQIACQRIRYFLVARGPPTDDLPPEYEWIVLCDGSDQLNRLRHVMSPRGPSPDSAQQQVQVSSPFRGLISAESIC